MFAGLGFGMAAAGSDADYIRYSTVTGYFLQDDPATDSSTFNYVRLLSRCGACGTQLKADVEIGDDEFWAY